MTDRRRVRPAPSEVNPSGALRIGPDAHGEPLRLRGGLRRPPNLDVLVHRGNRLADEEVRGPLEEHRLPGVLFGVSNLGQGLVEVLFIPDEVVGVEEVSLQGPFPLLLGYWPPEVLECGLRELQEAAACSLGVPDLRVGHGVPERGLLSVRHPELGGSGVRTGPLLPRFSIRAQESECSAQISFSPCRTGFAPSLSLLLKKEQMDRAELGLVTSVDESG